MMKQSMQPLVVESIALTGRHLIEASAGTGKTYSITRLYARLLLERKLSVQQILVVTFTRAATEELRGRIGDYLRELQQTWTNTQRDPLVQALRQRLNDQEVQARLHDALLHLDEAAIYTIHGYCKRVLTQQAFASGMPFDVTMEADTTELAVQTIADCFRRLTVEPERYRLLTRRYPTPEAFYRAFGRLMTSDAPILTDSVQALTEQKAQVAAQISQNTDFLREQLVTNRKKQSEIDLRAHELATLQDWLAAPLDEPMPKAVNDFINGNRYRGRTDIQAVLNPVKDLKSLAQDAAQAAEFEALGGLLHQLRDDFRQAKAAQRVLDFNDLIRQLYSALQGDQGDALAAALGASFPAALVDEFQDTDPQQYAIFDRVYQDAEHTLFMIGDPKQAIYSFRGGDVFAYLAAARSADYRWNLATNYRSSAAMVNGYNPLFSMPATPDNPLETAPSPFGPGIDYLPVAFGGENSKAFKHPLSDPAARAALQFVHFPASLADGEASTMTAEFRLTMARWCATEIQRLLNSGVKRGETPLEARDIALLVRSSGEAEIVQQALRECGLAAVYLSARDNVLLSAEAMQMEQALSGILHAEDDRWLLRALVSPLLGRSPAHLLLLQQDESAWEEERQALLKWREQWQRQGFIAMAMALVHERFRPPAQRRERALTNMLHLIELLQQASVQAREPRQLLEWLRLQQASEVARPEAELRLESDANLIRILTQHSAKGLEYPVVFVPFSTYAGKPRSPIVQAFHDDNEQMVWYLGTAASVKARALEEENAERARLLYVAITRAEQRCYLCMAPFAHPERSALGLLSGTGAGTEADPWPTMVQQLKEHQLQPSAIGARATNSGNNGSAEEPASIGLEVASSDIPVIVPKMDSLDDNSAEVSVFNSQIDRSWGLHSFSALARQLTQRRVGYTGLSQRDRDAEDALSESLDATSGNARPMGSESVPVRFALPKGARAGNFLHDVLEHLNFTDPNWTAVTERAQTHFGHFFASPERSEALQTWLLDVLATPLNANGLALQQLDYGATLRETEFYFPLVGSQNRALMRLLRTYRSGGNREAEQLWADMPMRRLEGMMHGYIDLIFEHNGQYFVCDYKSTWLGERWEHYHPVALHENIQRHWYDLQYLIYTLALHRYLAQRLPDYRPERHLGGVYYLYLRGMSTEAPGSGVYFTRPDESMIEALDALMHGEEVV
ncbi:exodeoxyribonuclease V subunit beta [Salinispirillum marinum]|uniref:RecBCD enzyme subunit RecB n=2 Tax=Saccharospirillaceae TaxID=255527 RepID=A0ABV8BGK1_9GAMM